MVNPAMSTQWKVYYQMRKVRQEQEQILLEAGYQQSEIQDLLTQSQTKLNDFVFKQIDNFKKSQEGDLKKQIENNTINPDQGGRDAY